MKDFDFFVICVSEKRSRRLLVMTKIIDLLKVEISAHRHRIEKRGVDLKSASNSDLTPSFACSCSAQSSRIALTSSATASGRFGLVQVKSVREEHSRVCSGHLVVTSKSVNLKWSYRRAQAR